MAQRESGPAGRVTIIAGAAGALLVVLDMATSGDPQAVEWLVLLVPFFLGVGLLAAAPAALALRLREDGRWTQSGALAGSVAVLVNVVSSTCPNLVYRLGGEQVAAVLAPFLPTALAPLLATGMGLLLAGLFGYLNRSARVASVGLGLFAILMATQVPAVAGPALLLAVDGPLLAGVFRVAGPIDPATGSSEVARSH